MVVVDDGQEWKVVDGARYCTGLAWRNDHLRTNRPLGICASLARPPRRCASAGRPDLRRRDTHRPSRARRGRSHQTATRRKGRERAAQPACPRHYRPRPKSFLFLLAIGRPRPKRDPDLAWRISPDHALRSGYDLNRCRASPAAAAPSRSGHWSQSPTGSRHGSNRRGARGRPAEAGCSPNSV